MGILRRLYSMGYNGVPFFTNKFALVKDGVIENIIIADSYPTAAKLALAHGCEQAVKVDQYPVVIGDRYVDGNFIHEGDEVERQLTLEEKNAQLEQENAELKQRVSASEDAILALLFPPM
jgi:hypothetical protein